jgi:hypothetical protein
MKINLAGLRKVATVKLDIEPEDQNYRNQFDDPECVKWIADQLACGNEWAWCMVTVTVAYGGFEAHDYLGGCSYENRAAFMQPGGYYDDMVTAALTELAQDLEKIANDHEIWEHDATYCFWCISKEFAATP